MHYVRNQSFFSFGNESMQHKISKEYEITQGTKKKLIQTITSNEENLVPIMRLSYHKNGKPKPLAAQV